MDSRDSRDLEDQLGGDGSVVQSSDVWVKFSRRVRKEVQHYLLKSPKLPIQCSVKGTLYLILCSMRSTKPE